MTSYGGQYHVFEMVKMIRNPRTLLTQVAITSHQNLDLIWDYGTVETFKHLALRPMEKITRCVIFI